MSGIRFSIATPATWLHPPYHFHAFLSDAVLLGLYLFLERGREILAVTSLGCSHLAIEAAPEQSFRRPRCSAGRVLTALTCPNRVSHLQVFDPAMSQLYSHGAAGIWHAGNCPPPTPSNPVCADPPRCDFGVNYSISAAAIAGGLDTVRLIPFAGDTTTNLTQIPAEVRLGITGIVPP